MSSTSSSECDCDEYCQETCGQGNYYDAPYQSRRPPVYSMGHPLIYYAQVQHQPMTRRQSSRESRKENRNFFKRAFRWYTQEHVPAQRSPDISGFATWLDAKYGEYLRDSRLHQASPSHLKQTPTSEPECTSDLCDSCVNKKTSRIRSDLCEACANKKTSRILRSDLCDACANKKNSRIRSAVCDANKKSSRIRSPWKKRKRANKEAGDVCDKPNKSCEFIMRPKDSPRQASECCRTTPTSIHKKSTTTLVSSHTDSANKTKIKSQSTTCCSCEQNVTLNKKPVQDGDSEREAEKLMKIIVPEVKETKIIEKPKKKTPKQEDEISCQCPEDEVVNVDTGTQYDKLKAEPHSTCCSADQLKPVPSKKQSKPKIKSNAGQQKDVKQKDSKQARLEPKVICQCSDEIIQKVDAQCQYQSEFGARPDNTSHDVCDCKQEVRSTCAGVCRLPANVTETHHIRNITYTRTRPLTILVSDVAQTSDHSINLDNDTVHGYPLFMKIVRADKLN